MKTVLKALVSIPGLSLSAVGLMAIMVACSGSSSSNNGDDAGDDKKDSGNDDDEDSGPKPDAGDDEDDAGKDANGNPGAACNGEKTQEACLSCCDKKSGGGRAVANKALKDCVCKDGSDCKAECGDTYCSDKPESKECAQCVNSSDCQDTAKQACAGDPKCVDYGTCADDSECADKDP